MMYLLIDEDGGLLQKSDFTDIDRLSVKEGILQIVKYTGSTYEIMEDSGLEDADEPDEDELGDATEIEGSWYTDSGPNWSAV